jgi:hypothetical protein
VETSDPITPRLLRRLDDRLRPGSERPLEDDVDIVDVGELNAGAGWILSSVTGEDESGRCRSYGSRQVSADLGQVRRLPTARSRNGSYPVDQVQRHPFVQARIRPEPVLASNVFAFAGGPRICVGDRENLARTV